MICNRKLVIAVKTLVSTIMGGAGGSMMPVVNAKLAEMSTGKPVHVDGHQMAIIGLFGAIAAVIAHWVPRPDTPASLPTCAPPKP